ncbi:MAG: hypothetical protein HY289_15845 [Planctomycetes bacterium]|nr:hypothetical protein [Planctomycetota bacterium]
MPTTLEGNAGNFNPHTLEPKMPPHQTPPPDSLLRRMLEIYQAAFDDRPGCLDRQDEASRCFETLADGNAATLELLAHHLQPGGLIRQFHPVLGMRPLAALVLQIALKNSHLPLLLEAADRLVLRLPVIPETQDVFEKTMESLRLLMQQSQQGA